ncbi:MAG: uridine monophosphate kinase [Candidatus Vogelbacteria bacterium]|nr:uridine monophosphate kinase [Candidatus Vogelbacteria bacterium]
MAKSQKRQVVLKLSGRVFSNLSSLRQITNSAVQSVAVKLAAAHEIARLAVVVGGGNHSDMDLASGCNQITADHIGMLATVMNVLTLRDSLQENEVPTVAMSGFPVPSAMETYSCDRARRVLARGEILLLAGGLGQIGFSTDTAAVVRARELGADFVFKGTTVAGVFNADPKHDPNARLIEQLSCHDFLSRGLHVILDRSAVVLAERFRLPIRVFDFREPFQSVIAGDSIGTLVHP